MKKLIATASAVLSISFAIALANAEEMTSNQSTSTTTTEQTMDGPDQMAGTAGTSRSTERSNDESNHSVMQNTPDTTTNSNSNTTTTTDPKVSRGMSNSAPTSRSCTDPNGVTYTSGSPGYDRCVDSMRKTEKHSEQTTTGDSSVSMNR